jgi:hypothetical protein
MECVLEWISDREFKRKTGHRLEAGHLPNGPGSFRFVELKIGLRHARR